VCIVRPKPLALPFHASYARTLTHTCLYTHTPRQGARIITNSWGGTLGEYGAYCRLLDVYTWYLQDLLLLAAAGAPRCRCLYGASVCVSVLRGGAGVHFPATDASVAATRTLVCPVPASASTWGRA